MTIYEIKRLTSETAPHYFAPKTLKFFGQTMRSFKVYKQPDGRHMIIADIRGNWVSPGRICGQSVRYFNPVTSELENL